MGSHLRPVLYTNQTPTRAQTLQLRDMAAATKTELTRIDDRLARLQAEMGFLVTKKKRLSDDFHKYQAALSQVRRLPYELIAKIFLHVKALGSLQVDSDPDSDSESEISTHPSIAVSQICSAWRSVAIQTPKLWSDVRVVDDGHCFDAKMRLLQLFCERSSKSLLSIDVYCLQSPINILATYLPRTVSLTLRIHEQSFLELCKLPRDSFPFLENFVFHSIREVNDEDVDEVLHFFDAPNLSQFTYEGHLHWRAIHLPSQISTLSLDRITLAQCIDTLFFSRNIETLRYTAADYSTRDVFTSVELPSLQNLELQEVVCRRSVFELLDYISAPKLDFLNLCGCNRFPWSPARALTSFVSESSCVPSTLFLSGTIMDASDFVQIAQTLPFLSHLRLGRCKFIDMGMWDQESEVVDALAQKLDSGAPKLLPNLKDLEITCISQVPSARFLAVAKSRWEPVSSQGPLSCLRSFLIHRDHPSGRITQSELAVQFEVRDLVNDGLSIAIEPLIE